jgi:hypothetical protein
MIVIVILFMVLRGNSVFRCGIVTKNGFITIHFDHVVVALTVTVSQ